MAWKRKRKGRDKGKVKENAEKERRVKRKI